jgi:hypothetical protein
VSLALPRTKDGRAKASQNAWRHGLATALRSGPGVVEEIERIAHAIVVEARRPDLIEYARRVAEAEIDLRRVRRARNVGQTSDRSGDKLPSGQVSQF